jgi:hypothetical protein
MALAALSQPGLAIGGTLLLVAVAWATGRPRWSAAGAALCVGLAGGLVLWLPALVGHPLRPTDKAALEFIQPADLALARWSYGDSPAAGLPLGLGTVGLGVGLVALGAGVRGSAQRPRAVLAGALGLAVFLSLGLAAPLWGPLALFFAQPWQTLGLAALALALLAALLPLPERPGAVPFVLAVALLATLASFSFLQPIFVPALPKGAPVLATFGDRIALVDYRLEPRAPGALDLSLDWQALRAGAEDYTVFAHLLGPDGRLVAQRDQPPLNGLRPSSGWARGEVISDRYRISLPAELPPGVYQIEVGLYRPVDGSRVSTHGDDHLNLTRVSLP